MLIAVQIDPRHADGADRGADDGISALLEQTERVAQGLEAAEVRVLGALSAGQLARALRTAFDPYARAELAALEAADTGRAGLAESGAWPLGADESWEHYRADGALHATFWIAQWPRVDVSPMFMDALLGRSSVVRTVAVTLEPITPERSTREVEAAVTRDHADRELRHRFGQSETARQRQAQESAARREAELAAGHAEVRLAGFVTVSGRDPDDLRRACAEVHEHGGRGPGSSCTGCTGSRPRHSPSRCRSAGGCDDRARHRIPDLPLALPARPAALRRDRAPDPPRPYPGRVARRRRGRVRARAGSRSATWEADVERGQAGGGAPRAPLHDPARPGHLSVRGRRRSRRPRRLHRPGLERRRLLLTTPGSCTARPRSTTRTRSCSASSGRARARSSRRCCGGCCCSAAVRSCSTSSASTARCARRSESSRCRSCRAAGSGSTRSPRAPRSTPSSSCCGQSRRRRSAGR